MADSISSEPFAAGRRPAHLPERLTISFPIWALQDTGAGGAYHDVDRFFREHKERGFNCVRFDDGAGVADFHAGAQARMPQVVEAFPGYSRLLRQSWCTGPGGECDLKERLFAFCEASHRHGVKLILSSWYYLHTHWYCGDDELNRRLHSLAPAERYAYFAAELELLLDELKARGYLDTIAFVEIFNESDGLGFVNFRADGSRLPPEEQHLFRSLHEKALQHLQEEFPEVLFAVDTATPYTNAELFPRNASLWNFHSYYMWDIYRVFERNLLRAGTDVDDPAELGDACDFFVENPVPLDQIRKLRDGKTSAPEDWFRRVWLYGNMDLEKTGELDRRFAREFLRRDDEYRRNFAEVLEHVTAFRDWLCPGRPLVMGEGVTFCASPSFHWEERTPEYWEHLVWTSRLCRRSGLWGKVVRTCCGPEDPCWYETPEQLLRVNNAFLNE